MEKDFSFLHYLKPVSAEEQAYEGLDPHELWLLYVSETDVLGPFRQNDIKKLLSQFRHEFAPLKACTVSQKDWKPFFNHSCFNNRDLMKELQPKTKFRKIELMADEYLCLVNGLKKGPYSQQQIIDFIKKKDLKSDALISADQGMTWHRAYTFPQFNRRSRQIVPESQMIMPQDDLEKTKLIILDKIKKAENADSGALSAALLSGKNNHLAKEKLNQVFTEKLKRVSGFSFGSQKSGQKKTNPFFTVVLVLALVLIFFIDTDNGDDKKSKRDPLEVLQEMNNRNTSSKYEDQSPPRPMTTEENIDEVESVGFKNDYKTQDNLAETQEDYADDGTEELDQDPNEYNDSQKKPSKREISSSRKKSIKKISVSHQDEDSSEGAIDETTDENLVEETEDFELEQ